MTNVAEVSSSQRMQREGPLSRVELGLELPPDLSAVAVALDDPSSVLLALDGSAAAADVPGAFALKRRAEYLAGRHAAGHALSALGLPARVGRSPNGLPLWPPGAVGSITHGGGL